MSSQGFLGLRSLALGSVFQFVQTHAEPSRLPVTRQERSVAKLIVLISRSFPGSLATNLPLGTCHTAASPVREPAASHRPSPLNATMLTAPVKTMSAPARCPV